MAKSALSVVGEKSTPDADLAKLKRYFAEARDLTVEARRVSLNCIDYYDSDQFTAEELAALAKRRQPPIVINRIKVAINGIIGVTEKGRSDPRAWPRNPGDDESADAATDVLRYIADFNRFKRIKQDCFLDMLVPGTMAALVGVDGDKQVTITQVRWEEHFADPRSRRKDFKDARYQGIAKWMYADDVSALYPDKKEAVDNAISAGDAGISPDASYQDRPNWGNGTSGAWIDKRQRRLMVVEMYYQESGWRRCVFTGSDILENGESPYQDHKGRPDCPVEAMSAYVKRDNARYGAVHDMIGVQDEINKRRSKALHSMSVSRIEAVDSQAINIDAEAARMEAARPDGVIPVGWRMSPNQVEIKGNLELLQEAKGEIERMGPNPALAGRSDDSSGRHLLARQQSGLIELGNLYGALEDWELRIYRQSWARAKQFWKAPQFIRVTDDEDAPKFVGLNQPRGQPVMGPDGQPQMDPATGKPAEGAPIMDGQGKSVLGYKNTVAEMDVDIEIDSQPDVGSIQQEQFAEIVELVKISPVYQQQIGMKQLIQLSTIPHKRSILDGLDEAAKQQAQAQAQAQQIAQAAETAKIGETQARTQLHGAKAQEAGAAGFAKASDALSYAKQVHAESATKGLEAGIEHGQQEQDRAHEVGMAAMNQAAAAQAQASDQAHSAASQDSAQAASAAQAQATQTQE